MAEELQVPWRAAEAMHWQLGEAEMARRAGVVPFSLAAINVEGGHRTQTSRGHAPSQSQGAVPREITTLSPSRSLYSRPVTGTAGHRAIPRRETISAPLPAPVPPQLAQPPAMGHEPADTFYRGPGLAPIQHQPTGRNTGLLPSVAELTGVSPHHPPVGTPGTTPHVISGAQREYFPPVPPYPVAGASNKKRRLSFPDVEQEEKGHRRRVD